jgi:hypothetical protein
MPDDFLPAFSVEINDRPAEVGEEVMRMKLAAVEAALPVVSITKVG